MRSTSRAEVTAITRTNHTPSENTPLALLAEQPLPEQMLQIHVTKFNTSDDLESDLYSLQGD
jgi:hypothetical protein